MSLPTRGSKMSAVAALRRAGRSYKEIARDFGVTVDAVKWWLREGFPLARYRRRVQLRAAIVRAIEDNDAVVRELRAALRSIDEADLAETPARAESRMGAGAASPEGPP